MATGRKTIFPRRMFLRRVTLALVCAPLLLMLAGCPGDASTAAVAAPGRVAPAITAPSTSNVEAVAAQQARETQAQETTRLLAANQQAQKVQQLINRAEASYKSGVGNYNANRLDAARADFDAAVDILLSSGIDFKSDPQLSDEFEHLLSAINSLEMAALKQGNGFSPKVEAAPLDIAEDVTFPSNPVLVGKVTEELLTTKSDFPLVVNDYVAGYINYFTNSPAGHAHLKRSLERAGKYKVMISRILREQGVPQDLIYQAVAESGFQPQALNARSGAGGMWQFMAFSGYGLTRNGYFDERFDPEKSTLAYARYMKALYNQFGDWYLAMAAYDWGPGNVQRVVSRTGYADFWELYRRNVLPGETKSYVPGIIAAMIMAKNPAQYGLTDLVPDAPVLSDKVTTTYAIDMKLVADLTGATVAEIVALNPALLRLATPRDIPYDLHLPPGTRDAYIERLKEIPEDKRASWRFHVVRANETLDSIAASFHARPSEVAEYNEVTLAKPIELEDELVVPIAASGNAGGQQRYTVRRSDTLVRVADRFGVTVEQLRSWNHLSNGRVAAGRSIYVAEPIRLAPGMHATRGRHARAGRKRGKAMVKSSKTGKVGKSSAAHTHSSVHRSAKSSRKKSSSNR
ncbi:MAG: transglycosylase SLT domain-containing protein [Acidobacteriota bacterium]|nr:transglycosylase SLT domain-containing protein [Acidobacteriota bacterium]